MKKLLVITLCLFSSLSLYSQEKEKPFWGLISFGPSGKVEAYQDSEKTIYDQLQYANSYLEARLESYKYAPNNKTTAPEFLKKVLSSGYCFAGSQEQAYLDVFTNSQTVEVSNVLPHYGNVYKESTPNQTTTPVIKTYTVSLDSYSSLKVVLTSQKECSEYTYIETRENDNGSRKWDLYACKNWSETNPNTLIKITACENWKEPLKEFLTKIYNLPKELFSN
jgi:hypothetical protein